MDEQLTDRESLVSRLRQVEDERDELRKDIEQLCMQQGGPGYLAVATRIHFQRTAALEQEIDNLKKNLAACTREKSNMEEELSEAYCVKGQLAELHAAEVLKCMESEKQVKFFQGCVAAAFAERDHSIMEAEKAKEKEELMLQKLSPLQSRVEELASKFSEEQKLTEALQTDVDRLKNQNEIFSTVINKFYEIRQYSLNGYCEDRSWEAKCECLLNDSLEVWDFNEQGETSTSKYIGALEEEVDTLRKSVDNIQNKLCVGLEIENHLKRRVYDLEKKNTVLEETIKSGISKLHNFHEQHKAHITSLLAGEQSHLKSVVDVIEEKLSQYVANTEQSWRLPEGDLMPDDKDCRDVHVNADAGSNPPGSSASTANASSDTSEALAQALQEKVSTLLLLSQQEERHLLEKNVNVALQNKVEELQRNLLQVTNEKVKALMGLAHVKREYQLLLEKIRNETGGQVLVETVEKGIVRGQDGRMKNLLKKTYLKHWIGNQDNNAGEAQMNYNGTSSNSSSSNYGMDVARMKIENATLKESLESMEHLTSAGRRLRLSLLKIQESVASEGTSGGGLKAAIDDIVTEAKLVKTALGSSLPVSWSAEVDVNPSLAEVSSSDQEEAASVGGDSKGDYVSAVGFELLETLIFAGQVLKEYVSKTSRD